MAWVKATYKRVVPSAFRLLGGIVVRNPRLLVPSLRDYLGLGYLIQENHEHIRAAMHWLATAQDATKDGGVAARFGINGWWPSFPETTGYIIPTFFDYSCVTGDVEYRSRAIRMADFLVAAQMENGAIQGGLWGVGSPKPIVFNTGQVVLGWVRAFRETGDSKYKHAAMRVGDWLVMVQDADGCWRKYVYQDRIHVYNVRVAWALLELYDITQKESYLSTAIKNIDWALGNQLENGWFKNNNTFRPRPDPLTHAIAYATRSILECGVYLGNDVYLGAAQKTAQALLDVQRRDGSLCGRYDSDWKGTVNWSCLTGDAQVSIIWLKLFERYGDPRYSEAATRINRSLKATQNTKASNPAIRGAVKGSQPIYGEYEQLAYPNWAAKFFVDALLLEEKAKARER